MISLVRQRLFNHAANFQFARTFLTSQQLGIDRFLQFKEKNLNPNKDVLINNIKSSMESSGFVYTEDLKSLAYLIDTPEDAKLMKDAFIKFASNDESIRLATFKIGPVVSRALYAIDDLESLKELFNNEKTSQYFQLRSAYNVYLSFLYKKEQYEEALNVGEKMFEKMFEESTNERVSRNYDLDNALIVYLAAANKIGNKTALDRARKMIHLYSQKMIKTGRDDKSALRLKQVLVYHLLCIKNNELNEALETLAQFNPRYYEFLNAKAAIQARLGRSKECLITLNKILDPENNRPKYIFTETIEIIKQQLEKNPDEELAAFVDGLNQDVVLDAKIEETILALPNVSNQNMRNPNRQGNFRQFNGNFNRFGRQFNNRDGGFDRFGGNRSFGNRDGNNQSFGRDGGFNRFGGNGQFGNRNQGDFNRFNDRSGNRFGNNRYDDDFSDSSRRPFRPFQTRFRDVNQESSDII